MSFASMMVHAATVRRPGHGKTDQAKDLGTTVVATDVPCRVEPAGDTSQASLLGIAAEMSRTVFFDGSANVIVGDLLILSTGETMQARSVEHLYAGSPGVHHLEVTASVRVI